MRKARNVVIAPSCATFSDKTPLEYPTGSARVPFKLQYSVHEAVRSVRREILYIFPSLKDHLKANGGLDSTQVNVLVTFQPSKYPLLAWTPDAAAEKDHLLENFFAFCGAFAACVAELEPESHTDFVDPCSGQPTRGARSSGVYSEVEGGQVLLGYPLEQVAQCVVIKHPDWGAAVYPATLVTTASAATIAKALRQLADVGEEPQSAAAEAEAGYTDASGTTSSVVDEQEEI